MIQTFRIFRRNAVYVMQLNGVFIQTNELLHIGTLFLCEKYTYFELMNCPALSKIKK